MELTPHDFLYWRNLGDAYRWTPGKRDRAEAAYRRAIELCDDAIRINPSEVYAHASKAVALAKLGNEDRARDEILRALELEPQNALLIYEAAVVSNIGGSQQETVSRLEQALRLGYNADDIVRDPEFANLQKSGTLPALIRNYRSPNP